LESIKNKGVDGRRMKLNTKPRYAIVDDKGKIVEKFRYKFTADTMLPKIQSNYYVKLKVIKL